MPVPFRGRPALMPTRTPAPPTAGGTGAVGVLAAGGTVQVLDERTPGHWAVILADGDAPAGSGSGDGPAASQLGNAYGHTALVDLGGGEWEEAEPGGELPWGTPTDAPAWEVTGRTDVPAGARVWLEPSLVGDAVGWAFRYGGGGGGGSDWFLARVSAAPTPEDDPPPGPGGDEWVPPRFSYHVYGIEPVEYDATLGMWLDDPTREGGTAYRAPSSQYPPPKIVEGQVVMARPSRRSPGKFEISPWGSVRAVTETVATHFAIVCRDGSGSGTYQPSTPEVIVYYRTKVTMARDLCVAQAPAGG
jgi:hypothetical protein